MIRVLSLTGVRSSHVATSSADIQQPIADDIALPSARCITKPRAHRITLASGLFDRPFGHGVKAVSHTPPICLLDVSASRRRPGRFVQMQDAGFRAGKTGSSVLLKPAAIRCSSARHQAAPVRWQDSRTQRFLVKPIVWICMANPQQPAQRAVVQQFRSVAVSPGCNSTATHTEQDWPLGPVRSVSRVDVRTYVV